VVVAAHEHWLALCRVVVLHADATGEKRSVNLEPIAIALPDHTLPRLCASRLFVLLVP